MRKATRVMIEKAEAVILVFRQPEREEPRLQEKEMREAVDELDQAIKRVKGENG